MQPKVVALEGEWTDSVYGKKVRPLLETPVQEQCTIPIRRMDDIYNNIFVESICNSPPSIGVLDWRHWYYNDELFKWYVDRVSSLFRIPVLVMPEYPFSTYPSYFSVRDFERALHDRTTTAIDVIKNNSDIKVLCSPVAVTSEENNEIFLRHIQNTHHLYDGYAVNCCNDMSKYSIAMLTNSINQCLRIENKDLWIVKWGIPASDENIVNKAMKDNPYKPADVEHAAATMRYTFSRINSMANCYWFYSVAGQDLYDGTTPNPAHLLGKDYIVQPEGISEQEWQYYHFLGLIDNRGRVKELLIDVLNQIAGLQNAKPNG